MRITFGASVCCEYSPSTPKVISWSHSLTGQLAPSFDPGLLCTDRPPVSCGVGVRYGEVSAAGMRRPSAEVFPNGELLVIYMECAVESI